MTVQTISIGAPTKCRSCDAAVIWANTPNGKIGPFEIDPNGHWVIEQGRARHVGEARQLELGLTEVTYYTSHFARCPDRDFWRKR